MADTEKPAVNFVNNNKELKFYKPTSSGNGAASNWQLSLKSEDGQPRWFCFLNMAQQGGKNDKGNAIFDWENKIIVKMESVDIGEMLAVINGRKDKAGAKDGLFHKSPNGDTKIIKLSKLDRGYSLQINAQSEDKKLTSISHMLYDGEVEVLKVFFQAALCFLNHW